MFEVILEMGTFDPGCLDPIGRGIKDKLDELAKQGKVEIKALHVALSENRGKFLVTIVMTIEGDATK